MVNLNGFKVRIPECLEETSGNYVVMQHGQQYSLELSNHHKDGTSCKPCDADVYIDGKHVGVFQISYGQSIILERPADDSGKFTAYKKGTSEFEQAELSSKSSELGLIEVIFKPGTKKVKAVIQPIIYRDWPVLDPPITKPWRQPPGVYAYAVVDWDSMNTWQNNTNEVVTSRGFSADSSSVNSSYSISENSLIGGGTGLSGESKQNFTEVEELDYDEPATTIFLRLAFKDNAPRPLRDIKKVYRTDKPRPLR